MPYGSFSLTALASLFKRPATTAFPARPYVPIAGTRGSLEVELGSCNFCSLCALRCPTGAIQVNRQEKTWTLDRFKCIVCAACVEACVKKSLSCSEDYAPPVTVNVPLRRSLADSEECPSDGGAHPLA